MGENRCACCLRPLYLGRGVRCKDCGEKSCRKGCSRFDPSDNAWRCIFCRQQRFLPARNCVEFLIQSLTQFLIFFSLLCPINLYCNLFPCKILVSFLREKRERFIEWKRCQELVGEARTRGVRWIDQSGRSTFLLQYGKIKGLRGRFVHRIRIFFFFIIIIKFNYFCFIEINSIISNYRILEKVG